jgi:large subunit ribosomal protein L25
MLVQELNALTVECLPAKIPASVELDISSLTESEQVIRVKDIGLDKEVTVLREPEMVVVRISSRPAERAEERIEEEQEAAAFEAPEATALPEEELKEE